jgi:prolyl-tRNA editing enzyme YbaK/EbsC (Cys-tRNA(Pro) deacylase)
MSLHSVRTFLAEHAPDIEIVDLGRDHTTGLISELWAVAPAQVAKTLVLRRAGQWVVAVACGDGRLDNRKCKEVFGGKVRMASAAEAEAVTGHPVGGVCPLGLPGRLPVFMDVALRRYPQVVPGAGSRTHAFRIPPTRLAELAQARWVDICG